VAVVAGYSMKFMAWIGAGMNYKRRRCNDGSS